MLFNPLDRCNTTTISRWLFYPLISDITWRGIPLGITTNMARSRSWVPQIHAISTQITRRSPCAGPSRGFFTNAWSVRIEFSVLTPIATDFTGTDSRIGSSISGPRSCSSFANTMRRADKTIRSPCFSSRHGIQLQHLVTALHPCTDIRASTYRSSNAARVELVTLAFSMR